VLCNKGELEDVKHFLDRCEEFSLEGEDLVKRNTSVGRYVWRWRMEENLLLGRSVYCKNKTNYDCFNQVWLPQLQFMHMVVGW